MLCILQSSGRRKAIEKSEKIVIFLLFFWQYEFEPCDNDPIDSVTIEHESVAQTLGQEARRWATRVLRETSLVRDATRKMNVYQAMRDAGQKVSCFLHFCRPKD